MAGVQLVNMLSGYSLNYYGLQPRSMHGLLGVLTSPFLHGSLPHLLSNAFPFTVFSLLIATNGARRYLLVSLLIIFIGGSLVWLFGREANHVGASGWVFGLWGYLIAQAWFCRSVKSLALAVLVIFLYGGMVFGFLPRHGISFESHLFGAVAGVVSAWVLRLRPVAGSRVRP
jgi:membrane associated rhomboid family serine protease